MRKKMSKNKKTNQIVITIKKRGKNGRFTKGKTITFDEFVARTQPLERYERNVTAFDRLFKTKNYLESIKEEYFLSGMKNQAEYTNDVIKNKV